MNVNPYAHFITIDLSPPVYLTDYHRDIRHDSKDFIAGKIEIKKARRQKAEPSANNFDFTISAVDQTMVSAFNQNYKGKRCLIQRVEFSEDQQITNLETWLDGDLNRYTHKTSEKDSILTISVGSVFTVFEKVNMLNIGLKFADTINDDQSIYWGKAAPSNNSGGGVGGGGGYDPGEPLPVIE